MPIIITVAFLIFLLQGCYLLEQAAGQLDLRLNQVAIDEAIHNETNARIKRLLGEVKPIKRFAETKLYLQPSENYGGYYRTHKSGITFVLTASRKDKLVPYTWWFPIIGRVPYKGFFDKEDALALERKLQKKGYDTWIFAAPTYSSLGWFKDPITTPMLRKGIYSLASIIIHEMTHVTLYVENQTDFNEQLATFVGHQGAMQYLQYSHREPEFVRRIEAQQKRRLRLWEIIQEYFRLLQRLYEKKYPLEKTLREREKLFDQLTKEAHRLFPHTTPFRWQFNNARLLQSKRYKPVSPILASLWKEGQGDWQKFWPLVRRYVEKQKW